MTGADVAALQAERSAAWFVDLTRPSRAALIESVIYALADLTCDLANGDPVDPAEYRDDATAAVGAVIEHLAWSEPIAALAEAERQRNEALARIARIREVRSCLGAGPMDYEAFTDEVDDVLAEPEVSLPKMPRRTLRWPDEWCPVREPVPPRVPGTTGPQNRSQGRGSAG